MKERRRMSGEKKEAQVEVKDAKTEVQPKGKEKEEETFTERWKRIKKERFLQNKKCIY